MEQIKQLEIKVTKEDFKAFEEVTKASNKTPEEVFEELVRETAAAYRLIRLLKKERENKGE